MIEKGYIRIAGVAFAMGIAVTSIAAETNLKEIMQGLRDDAVEIADGLLIDDFDRVASGATGIANHARIPPDQVQLVAAELGSEMPAFKQLDTLVHDLSLSIAAAAEKRDRSTAIAEFHRMLDGCLACHSAYKERVANVLSGTAIGSEQ
jgi:hypothetical protein